MPSVPLRQHKAVSPPRDRARSPDASGGAAADGQHWAHPDVIRHARLVGVLNRCRRSLAAAESERDQQRTMFQCGLRAAGVRIQHLNDDLAQMREEGCAREAVAQEIAAELDRFRQENEHNAIIYGQEVQDLNEQAIQVEQQVERAKDALAAASSRAEEEKAWVEVDLKPSCLTVEQKLHGHVSETSLVKRDLEAVHGHRTDGMKILHKEVRTVDAKVHTVRETMDDMRQLQHDLEGGLAVARHHVVRAVPCFHTIYQHLRKLEEACSSAADTRGPLWPPHLHPPPLPADTFSDASIAAYLCQHHAQPIPPPQAVPSPRADSPLLSPERQARTPLAPPHSPVPRAGGAKEAEVPVIISSEDVIQGPDISTPAPTNAVFEAVRTEAQRAVHALHRVEAHVEGVLADRIELENVFHGEASTSHRLHGARRDQKAYQDEIQRLGQELVALKQRVDPTVRSTKIQPPQQARQGSALVEKALRNAAQLKDEISALKGDLTVAHSDKRALERSLEAKAREQHCREAELAALRARLGPSGSSAAAAAATQLAPLPSTSLSPHHAALIDRLHLDVRHGVSVPRNMSPTRRAKSKRSL